MSVTSGFYNSLNGDRKYNAEQMSAIFDGIINDGILANIGTAFTVTADSGNTVKVGIGRAWFNSTWLYNDAILSLTLDDAEAVLDRIDAIVIEIDRSDTVRAGSIKVIKGTASSSPVNPTLTNTEYVHQYPLAYIYREADSTSIGQADITSKIGTSDCPYVTGILQVQNIDNIVAQWQAQWVEWYANETATTEEEADTIIAEWNQWYTNQTTTGSAQFTAWMAQMQSDLQDWFDALQVILDDNTAAELANQVVLLKGRFKDLAMDRAVYEDLEDSTEDTIEDSNGQIIQGRTLFALAGTTTESEIASLNANTGGESGIQYEVGDIITTARTDLSDTWVLCNGTYVAKDVYPQLEKLLGSTSKLEQFPFDPAVTSPSRNYINCVVHTNGYWVVGGTLNGAAAIAYTDDIYSDNWTIKEMWNSLSTMGIDDTIKTIVYANGYWVVGGSYYKNLPYIRYATSLDGTWHSATLSASSGFDEACVNSIICAKGYWIAATTVRESFKSSACIWYTSDLSFDYGIFTKKTIWSLSNDQSNTANVVGEVGDYIVIGGCYAGKRGRIAYATNPTASFTTRDIAITEDVSIDVTCLTYANGYLVIGGTTQKQIGDYTYGRGFISYSTNWISGTWTGNTINDYQSSSSTNLFQYDGVYSIAYGDGYWMVGGIRSGKGFVATMQTFMDDPPYDNLMYNQSTLNDEALGYHSIVYNDGFFAIAGTLYLSDGATSDRHGCVILKTISDENGFIKIPEISVDNAYAYIKALGG